MVIHVNILTFGQMNRIIYYHDGLRLMSREMKYFINIAECKHPVDEASLEVSDHGY